MARYAIEQVFVEQMYMEDVMSAATLISLPSVRSVAAARPQAGRPALRLPQWLAGWSAERSDRRAPVAGPTQRAASFPQVVHHLVIGAVVAVIAAVALGVMIALSGFLSAPVAGDSVVVQPGQSLWEVAVQTGSADVSQTVADIARLNGLTDSTIQAGQTLVLPAR